MKKIIILISFIFILCGCQNVNFEMDTYTDKDTCVMYIHRYRGGISVMYNADGTIKLNQKCVRNK